MRWYSFLKNKGIEQPAVVGIERTGFEDSEIYNYSVWEAKKRFFRECEIFARLE